MVVVVGCASHADVDGDRVASTTAEALVEKTELLSGDSTCPAGGVRVDSGADDDGDGDLDPEEVTQTKSVCKRAPGAPRVIFVSSKTYPAEIGGAAGADAECQSLADATPELQGKPFLALASDDDRATTESALAARGFVFDGSFVRPDGVLVSNDFDAMFRNGRHFFFADDAVLLAPIAVTERGEHVEGPVRTQLSPAGTAFVECPNVIGVLYGINKRDVGFAESVTNDWYDQPSHWIGCHEPGRIYCVEQ